MGIMQLPSPRARRSPSRPEAFVTGGVYSLVFLLGLLEGVVGSFQYSRALAGSVPVAAIAFAVVIFLTCGLSGWAMRGMGGALLPAIGWFVASFGLAMPNSGGSVIIANTTPGEWYLYGGSVCALLGVGVTLVTVVRRPLQPSGRPRSNGDRSGK